MLKNEDKRLCAFYSVCKLIATLLTLLFNLCLRSTTFIQEDPGRPPPLNEDGRLFPVSDVGRGLCSLKAFLVGIVLFFNFNNYSVSWWLAAFSASVIVITPLGMEVCLIIGKIPLMNNYNRPRNRLLQFVIMLFYYDLPKVKFPGPLWN